MFNSAPKTRRIIINGRSVVIPADMEPRVTTEPPTTTTIPNIPTISPFKAEEIDKNLNNIEGVSPFEAKINKGPNPNVEKVTPFIGSKNYYVPTDDGSSGYPDGGGGGEGSRAYYVLQGAQQIGASGTISLTGPLQIVPIWGTTAGQVIASVPFGTSMPLGSTVTLYGIDDDLAPKMVNSRTTNYGVWLNGSITFYEGYSTQLQLVTLGNYKLWLQISKNF
jgi:hypothetical protein